MKRGAKNSVLCRARLVSHTHKFSQTQPNRIKSLDKMRHSAVNLSKNALKYGGKSGVLPKLRPIFKKNPIVPKTEAELKADASVEQGYASGVPLPKRKGMNVTRVPVDKPVVPVEERIKKLMEKPLLTKDKAEMTEEEIWALQRDELRRQYLKEAYEIEAKRLEKIAQLEAKKQKKEAEKAQMKEYEELEATLLTLPTIDSYLKGPIMRLRTPEEQALVEERRKLNRRAMELEVMHNKSTNLLELYHAAGDFITTEKELEEAIKKAFGVNLASLVNNELMVEEKLFGYTNAHARSSENERLFKDAVLGEVDGKPGVEVVKDTLSGVAEQRRRAALSRRNA